MNSWHSSRRAFLTRTALGLGGIAFSASLPKALIAAHEHANRSAASGNAFKFFTAEEAADVKAFAAQVIPSDDTPGATEANVVFFIDHVLTEYEPAAQGDFRAALADLNAVARKMFPASTRFSALSPQQQGAVMLEFEKAPSSGFRSDLIGVYFALEMSTFEMLREFVIAGFLSDPELGGNKDMVGWQVIGYDGMAAHEPPFGFYDAELLKQKDPK